MTGFSIIIKHNNISFLIKRPIDYNFLPLFYQKEKEMCASDFNKSFGKEKLKIK